MGKKRPYTLWESHDFTHTYHVLATYGSEEAALKRLPQWWEEAMRNALLHFDSFLLTGPNGTSLHKWNRENDKLVEVEP